jgi:hypothetical protein
MGLVIEMSLSGFCSSSFLPLWSFETVAFFDFIDFSPSFGLLLGAFTMPICKSRANVHDADCESDGSRRHARALNYSIRS